MIVSILISLKSPPLHARSETIINLLITSDIHGWLSTSKVFPNRRRKGLLHLSEHIKIHRKKDPDLILLDAGDLLQGSPLSQYHQSIRHTPSIDDPFFRLMKSLNFDAVTIGNHDLAIGLSFEKDYVLNSNFTWLGANIYKDAKSVFKPYKVIHRRDLKIIVLGLTTPGSLMWLNIEQLNGFKIRSVTKSAVKWLKIIKKVENPDFIIGLFHVGLNPVRDDENSKLNEISEANSALNAISEASGFDFVITGHDHRLFPSKSGQSIKYVGKTPVVEAGHWGEVLLNVKLRFKKSKNRWVLKNVCETPENTLTRINVTAMANKTRAQRIPAT